MKKSQIKSYCKINLSLRVISKNAGYHNITSFVTFSKLHDLISIKNIDGLRDRISFSGQFKKGINIKSNTVTEALYLLRKSNLLKNKYFQINIKKMYRTAQV